MTLKECNTVKQCLLWAESTWPHFWEFATCKNLTETDLYNLCVSLGNDEELFNKFLKHYEKIAKIDRTEEADNLIVLNAKAFTFNQINRKKSYER